ncbi:hypothetical protein [Staphylococcus aureus]|uniref:hypothetical protein n=1 Tax=Staphylococcus aureus TaxID=1280 RepID=UPI0033651284
MAYQKIEDKEDQQRDIRLKKKKSPYLMMNITMKQGYRCHTQQTHHPAYNHSTHHDTLQEVDWINDQQNICS